VAGGEERRRGDYATTVAVYIIISSYDYFAFCLSTDARRGQSSKAYLLFSVKGTRGRVARATFFNLSPRSPMGRGGGKKSASATAKLAPRSIIIGARDGDASVTSARAGGGMRGKEGEGQERPRC